MTKNKTKVSFRKGNLVTLNVATCFTEQNHGGERDYPHFDDDARCCECGEYITTEDYRRDGFCPDCREDLKDECLPGGGVMDQVEWEEFRFGAGFVEGEE